MNAADSRSGRIRRREEEEDAAQQATQVAHGQSNNQSAGATMAASSSPADLSAAAAQPHPPSLSVQPLPEQIRKRPRRSPRFSNPLDMLAVVELQLCLQFLDRTSRLVAARCSRRLLQVVSAPFAWRSAPPFVVEVSVSTDVQRICASLLQFAPIHLRCVGVESLQCVGTVPHFVGLDLLDVRVADLSQLLQHPNLARLQLLRLDDESSRLLTVDTMRLVARLPQLRTFDVTAPFGSAGATSLQPLTDAPALADLTVRQESWEAIDAGLVAAISGCAGLRRVSLHRLIFSTGLFIALCSSSNMSRLRHLELVDCLASGVWDGTVEPPQVVEYRAAFSALEQLQSLTLETVFGIDALLAHLHRAPALRLLSIRCQPDGIDIDDEYSTLPTRAVLSALLTVAPQLEVRLCLAATLDRWLALDSLVGAKPRAVYTQQWRELHRMATELERVTILNVDE